MLKTCGLSLSEINDYFIPEEGKVRSDGKLGAGLALKRKSREEIPAMENIEAYGNALCQGEAASINELTGYHCTHCRHQFRFRENPVDWRGYRKKPIEGKDWRQYRQPERRLRQLIWGG